MSWWLGRESNPRHRDFQSRILRLSTITAIAATEKPQVGGLLKMTTHREGNQFPDRFPTEFPTANGSMFYTSARLRRQHGHWYGILSYKDGGTWRERSKRLEAESKRAAEAELAEWRMRAELESSKRCSSQRVVPYMLSVVDSLEGCRAIEKSTAGHYRKDARAWEPWLGDVRMCDLTRDSIELAVSDMLAQGRAATTVNRRLTMLKMACEEAVERGDLAKSPARGVRRPKLSRPKVNYCDKSTRDAVFRKVESLPTSRYTVAYQIALRAGLRRSEICALQVQDFDQTTKTLWVRRSIGMDGSKPYVKDTKTDRDRDVPLTDAVVEVIAGWLAHQRREWAAVGLALRPTDWLLGYPDGHFMSPDVLSRKWASLAENEGWLGAAGKRPTLHDLRHTFATVAVASGADVKSVSSILGHANTSMTLDVYASADKRAKRDAAALIDSQM